MKNSTLVGAVLCAIGFHNWMYRYNAWMDVPKDKNERHCLGCERHEHHRYDFWMKDVVQSGVKVMML